MSDRQQHENMKPDSNRPSDGRATDGQSTNGRDADRDGQECVALVRYSAPEPHIYAVAVAYRAVLLWLAAQVPISFLRSVPTALMKNGGANDILVLVLWLIFWGICVVALVMAGAHLVRMAALLHTPHLWAWVLALLIPGVNIVAALMLLYAGKDWLLERGVAMSILGPRFLRSRQCRQMRKAS